MFIRQQAPMLLEPVVHVFGEKLRALRQAHHLSQTELASRLQIQRSHVNNLEAGRRDPSIILVCQLSDFFRISIDYVLREEIAVASAPDYALAETITASADARTYARRLRELRLQHSLNQTALSQRLGLRTQAHISLLEHGQKEPSIALVLRTADTFEISIDSLLRDAHA